MEIVTSSFVFTKSCSEFSFCEFFSGNNSIPKPCKIRPINPAQTSNRNKNPKIFCKISKTKFFKSFPVRFRQSAS